MFAPDVSIYNSPHYLVLDMEVDVRDGGYGSAQDSRNQLALACWKRNGQLSGHFGNELEQNQLLEAVISADFIVAHNAKYELAWLQRMGVDIEDLVVFDTMLAEYVLSGNLAAMDSKDGTKRVEISLDACCRRRGMKPKDRIVDIWMKNGIPVSDMPSSWLLARCKKDVLDTEALFLSQRVSLNQSKRLPVLYTRCLLTPVLVDVESQGMKLDAARVLQEHTKVTTSLIALESQLSTLTGGINWKSSKQVGEYLYDTLKFRELTDRRGEPIRTDSGKRATDSKTLAKLRASTPEQSSFLELRATASKLASALSKNLDYFKHACETNDGVIYGKFNQAVTATNRLSSSGVPTEAGSAQFQNMPRAFKSLFTAREEGWKVMEIDGSGLEFRIAAYLGNDRQARADLANPKWDPHITSAAEMNGLDPDEMFKAWKAGDKRAGELRTAAKEHTFAPLFGKERGNAKEEKWYKEFRRRYSDLGETQKGWVSEVLLRKRLITPWGLRFYWPTARVDNGGYCNVQNSIFNYPIQALATAEIIPVALVYFWHATSHLRESNLLRITNTVHDSVVVELHPDCVSEVRQIAIDSFGKMCYAYLKRVYNMDFDVALGVGIKIGSHWGEGVEESYNVPLDGTCVKIK